MKTVGDIMVTIQRIEAYVEQIDNREALADYELGDVKDLLNEYSELLLNMKVKE